MKNKCNGKLKKLCEGLTPNQSLAITCGFIVISFIITASLLFSSIQFFNDEEKHSPIEVEYIDILPIKPYRVDSLHIENIKIITNE